MFPYDVVEWADFFVAGAGATAALCGLVFVAVSINVERILSFPGVPDFAMVTLLMLLGVLIVSLLGLIPGQSTEALGWELIGGGAVWAVLVAYLINRSVRGVDEGRHLFSRVALPLIGMVPLAIGAVSLVAQSGGGLYWVAGGIVSMTVAAVFNAWILLIEILR